MVVRVMRRGLDFAEPAERVFPAGAGMQGYQYADFSRSVAIFRSCLGSLGCLYACSAMCRAKHCELAGL